MSRLILVLLLGGFVLLIPRSALSTPQQFSETQIDRVQASIQNSQTLSNSAFELLGNAHENISISSSNFEKTKKRGFLRASDMFNEAKQKLLLAKKMFDDAWIQMRSGLELTKQSSIQEGIKNYNSGVRFYNEGLQLLVSAHALFTAAFEEHKLLRQDLPRGVNWNDRVDILQQVPSPDADSPWSKGAAGVPAAAALVLFVTLLTSVRAFRNADVYRKFTLYPWSLLQQGEGYCSLLTSGLIHADAKHLTLNMIAFCLFAFTLETIVGHLGLLLIYFGSLIFSSFIVTIKNGDDRSYRVLGASGAIAGLTISYLLYRPFSSLDFIFAPLPIPAFLFALFYVACSCYLARKSFDNPSYDALAWGAISGGVVTLLLDPRSISGFWERLSF